jgi:cytochrome c
LFFLPLSAAFGADKAAESLARKSGCLKCHAIDKEKVAPSYKSIAAKYKGDADAEQKLFTHLTTSPTVKVDGVDETHASLKTKNDEDVRGVARWILSL